MFTENPVYYTEQYKTLFNILPKELISHKRLDLKNSNPWGASWQIDIAFAPKAEAAMVQMPTGTFWY